MNDQPKFSELCRKLLSFDPCGNAVQFEGEWRSWGWVQNLARQIGEHLASSGANHVPVSFVARNHPAALAGLVGLITQDRTIRMIYAFQSPAAIAASITKLASPALVLMDRDLTPEVATAIEAADVTCITLSEDGATLVRRGHIRANSSPDPSPTIDILTSGTTGSPKQYPIAHAVFAHMMINQNTPVLQQKSAPPFLMAFPFGNIAGLSMLIGSFLQGQPIMLLDRFSLDVWRDYVVRYRPASVGLPSAAIPMILNAKLSKDDLASVKYVTTGAAPLDVELQRAFQDTYGARILLVYGATEFGGPVTAMTPALDAEWGDTKLGSSGRALPGVKLRVRDQETGDILPADEIGLLEVVSPRIGTDWIRTSDLVRIDADGFLYCIGRADGAIMRGGFKILPETLEQVLRQHPAVAFAGVVGIEDRVLHQVPGAVIQFTPQTVRPDFAELEGHVRARLPSPYVPARWQVVETMPLNSAYKIDRAALRNLFLTG